MALRVDNKAACPGSTPHHPYVRRRANVRHQTLAGVARSCATEVLATMAVVVTLNAWPEITVRTPAAAPNQTGQAAVWGRNASRNSVPRGYVAGARARLHVWPAISLRPRVLVLLSPTTPRIHSGPAPRLRPIRAAPRVPASAASAPITPTAPIAKPPPVPTRLQLRGPRPATGLGHVFQGQSSLVPTRRVPRAPAKAYADPVRCSAATTVSRLAQLRARGEPQSRVRARRALEAHVQAIAHQGALSVRATASRPVEGMENGGVCLRAPTRRACQVNARVHVRPIARNVRLPAMGT